MKINNITKYRTVAIIATVYILVAFGWWSLLLMRKNEELRQAHIDLLQLYLQQKGLYQNEVQFKQTPEYIRVLERNTRQNHMIWQEGGVLFIGLLWGIWAINRSFQREIALNLQQSNFLLSITHELKSPISSIRLILQTFQKRKLDETQQAKFLQSAIAESDRLHGLVDNLLLSSRLDTAYEKNIEEINISPLLDDLIEKCRLKFPRASFSFLKNEVPILRGDKQGLISVFTNLIENAVKYSGEKPEITIKQNYKDNKFVFEIADNGIGIPADERHKVFKKFYRIGSEMTRQTKGTGLGLYIVAQIVKLHRGVIQISENAPKGTIFRIILPT